MNSVADTSGEGPAHQITYGYDWRGVRVSRTETPTDAGSASRYFFYSPELQLLESTVDDSNNVWGQSTHHITSIPPLAANRDIIWFNGAPVAEIGPARTPDNTPLSTHRTFVTAMDATTTFWTFTDHLGTPLIQTDNTTAIVWRAEHEPYGNVWLMRKGARTDQPLRFPGQELAMTWEGSEENYNVFRWYRAGWGRYTQSDPLASFDRRMQALKQIPTAPYLYAVANPLLNSDLKGLWATGGQLSYGDMLGLVQANNLSGQSTWLIICMAWKESSFNYLDQSGSSSARGLLQMTKGAASQVGYDYDTLFEPSMNIQAGTAYLAWWLKFWKGNLLTALDSYGTGPGYGKNILECESCLKSSPLEPKCCLDKIHK
jgi:RHS repeat-associated protein